MQLRAHAPLLQSHWQLALDINSPPPVIAVRGFVGGLADRFGRKRGCIAYCQQPKRRSRMGSGRKCHPSGGRLSFTRQGILHMWSAGLLRAESKGRSPVTQGRATSFESVSVAEAIRRLRLCFPHPNFFHVIYADRSPRGLLYMASCATKHWLGAQKIHLTRFVARLFLRPRELLRELSTISYLRLWLGMCSMSGCVNFASTG